MKSCAFLFFIGNHFLRKYLSILLQLVPYNDRFKVTFDIMTHWYERIITIIITIQ